MKLETKFYKKEKEIATEFKNKLKELLKRHNTTIELEDLPTKHPFSVPEKTIKVYIIAHYRKNGKCLSEWAEIDLGNYLDGY